MGTRIVVGYTAAGYSSAPALERELGVELIGRIGALRADVLRLDSGEPDGALALLRSDPGVLVGHDLAKGLAVRASLVS